MKIKVLGMGCAKCETLLANVKEAVNQTGVEAEIEKVTDFAEIAKYGILMTPGLVIDEEVKSAGKLLNTEEIARMIK